MNSTHNLNSWDYFNFGFNCPQWTVFKSKQSKHMFDNGYDSNLVEDYW